MRKVIIHTDGSCWPNPGGPGGWGAVIIVDGQRIEVKGHIPAPTTNNRAELIAAIEALNFLMYPADVDLYTDSEYLRNGAAVWMHTWKRRGFKKVKNVDLWSRVSVACEFHHIRWHWVRGHDTCADNIQCDKMAEEMRNAELVEQK